MELQKHLYNCSTVPEILESYIKELSGSQNIEDHMHANKLKSYKNVINDRVYINDMRVFFNKIFNLLSRKHPNLRFSIAGRKKSLISTEIKILQYLELGRSLDLIRDFFAFRIIVFGNNTIDLIEHCYKIIEEIVELGISNGFMPCERLPLLDVDNVNLPQNDFFGNFKYRHFIKDYICFPKENGYQSLHLVLVDTKGRYLEIQVRTIDMHSHIECSEANHENYKKQKYKLKLDIEREKINLQGYNFINNHVVDMEGIEVPVTVFERQTL